MAHLRTIDASALVFDFGNQEVTSSVMIGVAVRVGRQFRGAVAFCGQSHSVRSVYEGMNLNKLWPYFESRDLTVASFDS
jgi:hypothetical protein